MSSAAASSTTPVSTSTPTPVRGKSQRTTLSAKRLASQASLKKFREKNKIQTRKITSADQLKKLKSRSTSRGINPYFVSTNVGSNQNWLSEMSPDFLSGDNALWTKDVLSNFTPSTTFFVNEDHFQVISVGDMNIIFNDGFSGGFECDNSTIRITSDKYGQLSNGAQSSIDYYQESWSYDVTAWTGFHYGSYHDGDIYYFTTASLVPLEQDSTGQIVTWRLDMTRNYDDDGDVLAMQVLIRLTKHNGYSQLSFSVRQTTAETNYMNTQNYYYSFAYITSPTGMTAEDYNNEVYHSSYSIESILSSGGILPYFSDDGPFSINNYSEFGLSSGGDGQIPDLSGVTFHARFPDQMVTPSIADNVAPAVSDKTNKLIFGFDLLTLFFVLLIVMVAIFMIIYSTKISENFGWTAANKSVLA